MNDIQSSYSELIALTQLFLLREHGLHHQIISDAKSCHLFLSVDTKQHQKKPLPVVKKEDSIASQILSIPKQATLPTPVEPQPSSPKPDFPPHTPQPAPKPNPIDPPPQPHTPEPTPQPHIPPSPQPPQQESKILPSKGGSKGSNFSFVLEPFNTVQPLEHADFSNCIKQQFPHYLINEQIPSDHYAQKIKNTWYIEQSIPPIVLLSFNDQDKHVAFLKNVAQAINLYLAPARVLSGPSIEQDKQWETILNTSDLRLVIASDYGLYLLPNLMKHYKEHPKTAKHFLHQTPLLLLSDISLYLKEPQLKPLLWRAICTEFENACKIVPLLKK